MAKHSYQLDASRKWTDAQRAGVLDRSGSVIVSAAAGTGKTSVLTERCVSLVAGPEAIDIDRLLVVTFTEAAALEMRGRIREALAKLHEKTGWGRLTHQLMLLDAASISTLHSFCLQVVRENFSTAGIDPDAGVLDDDEAQLLKDDVLNALFDRLYTGKDERSKQFVQFVASYGQGQDDSLRGHVKHLHEYLRSLPPTEREGWKQRAVAAYELDKDAGLTSEQFDKLRAALRDEIDILLEMGGICLTAFEQQIGPHKGLDSAQAVQEYARQLREQLETVKTAAGLRQWIEAAGNLPWTKVSRWGDVPECCRDWAKWLHEHWDKTLGDRWLAPAEAWSHGLSITGPYAELLIWLVNQFEQGYARSRRLIGKIDYSDMEEHAFRLLAGEDGKGSEIAQACQQRYAFVLVDEFQDINPIQAAILRLVSRESAEPPEPNMFTVGDVKQSIYGFRMTDPGEFLKRQKVISEGAMAGRSIRLQENFRSRPEVLEAINRVFRKLMRGDETGVQYDESAELKPGREWQTRRQGDKETRSNDHNDNSHDNDSHGLTRINADSNNNDNNSPAEAGTHTRPGSSRLSSDSMAAHDAAMAVNSTGVAPQCVELHILDGGKGNAQDEDTQGGDGAGEDDVEQMLDREKEAYLIARRVQQLVGTEFQDGDKVSQLTYRNMVILLRGTQKTAEVYANTLRRCGVPVYAELRSGYFASREIKDMLSLLAVLENMQQDIPLAAVLRSPLFGEALSDADLADIRLARQDLEFHQAVRWYAESGKDASLRRKVAQHVGRLDRWRSDAQIQPLAEVIAAIYQETGLLEYATLLADGMQCRANLLSLYERARQFGQFSRQGLRRFVTFVGEMIRSGREARTPTAVNEAQDVVRIMSIHASKGLEFPVVFLADLARKFNDMDFNGSVVLDREGTLGIEARDPQRMLKSDTLVKLLAARKVRQQSRAEELRVLYVAMTRAKERLVLVGTRKKDPTEWLAEQRQLWHGWSGQLPRYLVRYASCPLDWIVPALAADGRQGDEETRRQGEEGRHGDAETRGRGEGDGQGDKETRRRGATGASPEEARPQTARTWHPAGTHTPITTCSPGNDSMVTPFDFAQGKDGVTMAPGDDVVAITVYPREMTDAWRVERQDGRIGSDRVLAALDGKGGKDGGDGADAAIARLTKVYRYEKLTSVPAIKPVTELKGLLQWDEDGNEGPRHAPPQEAKRYGSSFARPRRLRPVGTGDTARQKGTATHLFLEKIDLCGPADRKSLQQQLEGLVTAHMLTRLEADQIDLASVDWLLNDTDLGKTLRQHHRDVRREMPFLMRLEPHLLAPGGGSNELEDAGIVRGVIDVLWCTPEGIEIADFKTDAVSGPELRRRIEEYKVQLRMYALAIQRIWKMPVQRLWLAFLHARHIEPF